MLYSQNLQKQTRNFFQNGGGGARSAGPGSAFGHDEAKNTRAYMIYLVFAKNVSKIFLRHLEESKCLIHISLCKEYHLKCKAYD